MARRTRTVSCTCGTCGSTFAKYASQVALGEGKFCSRACASVWRKQQRGESTSHWKGGQSACTCLHCGAIFYVDPNRVRAGRGKHCSQACYWARNRGPANHFYKHGNGSSPYTGGFTKSVRDRVFARDVVCVDCGGWDDRPRCMQVHHVDFGHQDHSLANLVLLCVVCHTRRHHDVSVVSSTSLGQSN